MRSSKSACLNSTREWVKALCHHHRAGRVLVMAAGCVSLLSSCEMSRDEAPSPLSPMPTVPGGTTAACLISNGSPGTPVTGQGGPYFHQVVVAQTTDGLTMTGARQVLDHASVPDGVRRADGAVDVYYVNGSTGYVSVARLEADSARVLGQISIDGNANPVGVVDPDVVLLPDGRVRLAYFWGFGPPGPAATTKAMCIAESADGLNFTTKATALTFASNELLTDPSLLALPDGSWLMAISAGQSTIIARSADGLTFSREATFAMGGVPELAKAADGAIRLYVCRGPLQAYRSTDAGRTWAFERTVLSPPVNGHSIVCDPSSVAGAGLFVFKTG